MLIGTVLRFLLRNTTVVNALVAADIYGYPRVYRRALEILRKQQYMSLEHKEAIAANLTTVMRAPSRTYSLFTHSHTAHFLLDVAEDAATKTHVTVSPAALAVAEMLFRRTPAGRVVDILRRAAAKREQEGKHKKSKL